MGNDLRGKTVPCSKIFELLRVQIIESEITVDVWSKSRCNQFLLELVTGRFKLLGFELITRSQ